MKEEEKQQRMKWKKKMIEKKLRNIFTFW